MAETPEGWDQLPWSSSEEMTAAQMGPGAGIVKAFQAIAPLMGWSKDDQAWYNNQQIRSWLGGSFGGLQNAYDQWISSQADNDIFNQNTPTLEDAIQLYGTSPEMFQQGWGRHGGGEFARYLNNLKAGWDPYKAKWQEQFGEDVYLGRGAYQNPLQPPGPDEEGNPQEQGWDPKALYNQLLPLMQQQGIGWSDDFGAALNNPWVGQLLSHINNKGWGDNLEGKLDNILQIWNEIRNPGSVTGYIDPANPAAGGQEYGNFEPMSAPVPDDPTIGAQNDQTDDGLGTPQPLSGPGDSGRTGGPGGGTVVERSEKRQNADGSVTDIRTKTGGGGAPGPGGVPQVPVGGGGQWRAQNMSGNGDMMSRTQQQVTGNANTMSRNQARRYASGTGGGKNGTGPRRQGGGKGGQQQM